eukprot:CAMPEP_0178710672 /NCGR_PEP_ID=MMETSP0699-20121125/17908_1 /TAXON_ID=265572 /ORGANISM="Extubocellulus spinifer, Strain CCMP396" /LENGTH=125 /DNA_ID=CAMNT_0020359241 /DNA_START=43 /DNA_END=416 /DNA_ORIENTATION=-
MIVGGPFNTGGGDDGHRKATAVPVISKLPSRAAVDPAFLRCSTAHTTVLIGQKLPYDVVERMLVFSGCHRLPGGSFPRSFRTMGVFGLIRAISGTSVASCALSAPLGAHLRIPRILYTHGTPLIW